MWERKKVKKAKQIGHWGKHNNNKKKQVGISMQ